MAQLSDQTQDNVSVLMVVSRQPKGYRRAGLAFNKGDNHLSLAELSAEQVAAIKADTRLKVFETSMAVDSPGSLDIPNGDPSLTTDITGTLTGVKAPNGEEKTLDKLTVNELLEELSVKDLKALAKDLEIKGFNSMNKPDLVSAIQAVKVTVPGASETAAPSAETPSTETKSTEGSDSTTAADE